jgi:hypothetical protein
MGAAFPFAVAANAVMLFDGGFVTVIDRLVTTIPEGLFNWVAPP